MRKRLKRWILIVLLRFWNEEKKKMRLYIYGLEMVFVYEFEVDYLRKRVERLVLVHYENGIVCCVDIWCKW